MPDIPTVRLEPNGSNWRFAWSLNGKVHRVGAGVSGPLSNAAKRRLIAEKTAELAKNPLMQFTRGAVTLGQWRVMFFANYDRDPQTVSKCELAFDRMEAYFGSAVKIKNIDESMVAGFETHLAGMKKADGKLIELATVRSNLRLCKVIFGRAFREARMTGMIGNPFAHVVASAPSVDVPCGTVDADALERIFGVCRERRSAPMGWLCLFALTRLAGLRAGEARRVEWGHITDLFGSTPILRVHKRLDARGRKREDGTKARTRLVPLRPQLVAILREAFHAAPEGSTGPCEGIPADPSHEARKIVNKAGVVCHKPLHDQRQNAEDEIEGMGIRPDAVAKMFGHDHVTKLRSYTRLRESDVTRLTDPEAEKRALLARLAELEKR